MAKKVLTKVGVIAPTDRVPAILTKERGFDTVVLYESLDKKLWPADLDIVVFCGGSDVTPYYYGERPHPSTHNNVRRDAFEKEVYLRYKKIQKIGICRGAQFLCVLNGGKLYQDIQGHHKPHSITDLFTGEVVEVTSDHHQACIPLPDWGIIANSTTKHAETYNSVFDNITFPEAFYVPKDGSLCVQFHPEWGLKSCEEYFFSLIERYID